MCREIPARLEVTHTGAATRLSQLARLVEHAQSQRPRLARAADRVGSVFVSALIVLAVIVYAVWRIHEPARAFEVTLSLLVISCPCALSLAVPAALAASHGALARLGVLSIRAGGMEQLARVSDMVFDKTGTLTSVQLAVGDVQTFADFSPATALQMAAALERDSGHPIAQAFAGTITSLQATSLRCRRMTSAR